MVDSCRISVTVKVSRFSWGSMSAGASVLAHAAGGLLWITAEIITALVAAIYCAWLLLIEIRCS